MHFRILADIVVLIHLLFILFVVTGGFLALFHRKILVLHLPAACWGMYIEFSGSICPLTPMENSLRRLAGMEGYPDGFIEHYLIPVIYPPGLTQEIQLFLGLIVLVVNFLAYYLVFRRRPMEPSA